MKKLTRKEREDLAEKIKRGKQGWSPAEKKRRRAAREKAEGFEPSGCAGGARGNER